MTRRVEVHGERTVYDGFFRLVEADVAFERFDGTMSPVVKRLSLERGDAVAALLHHVERDTLILVEQFKYPTLRKDGGWIAEVVAGMIDRGEAPEAALRREVLEEAGYAVRRVEPIATFYVSPGGSSERIFLYYAEVGDGDRVEAGGGLASEHEDIRLVELGLDEALGRVQTGELADAKTIVGLLWLQNRRLTGSG